MNQMLVPVNGKRVKDEPPEPPEIDIEERCFLFERGHKIAYHVQRAAESSPLNAGTWREVIGNARQFLKDDYYRMLPGLSELTERWATRQEISKAIVLLSAVIQYNKTIDMELFAPVLTQDIAELHPSKLALCMAIRKLRKKSEWGPPIATVLEAVEWAKEKIPSGLRAMNDLSENIEGALENYRLWLTRFVVKETLGFRCEGSSYRWELKCLAADYLIRELIEYDLIAAAARLHADARKPKSLFHFLAWKGGLRPDPELRVLLDGNPSVPGLGKKLIRKSGMSLDAAREACIEEGFLQDHECREQEPTINDLLALIAEEARGNKQFRLHEAVDAWECSRAELPSEAPLHICRDKFPADIVDEALQMIEQYDLLTDDRPDLMLITGKQLVAREQAKWLTPPEPQKKLSPTKSGNRSVVTKPKAEVAIINNKPEPAP